MCFVPTVKRIPALWGQHIKGMCHLVAKIMEGDAQKAQLQNYKFSWNFATVYIYTSEGNEKLSIFLDEELIEIPILQFSDNLFNPNTEWNLLVEGEVRNSFKTFGEALCFIVQLHLDSMNGLIPKSSLRESVLL